MPGRLITDNVLIAYECLRHLKLMKEGKRSYAAMKLDMIKAYDRVEWIFIEKMIIKIGFSQWWVNKGMSVLLQCCILFNLMARSVGK